MKVIFVFLLITLVLCNKNFPVFDSLVLQELNSSPFTGTREFSTSFLFNDEIYLTGGINLETNIPYTDSFVFNLTSYTWKSIESIPHVLYGYARSCTVVNGTEVLVFGGADVKGRIVGDLVTFNLQTLSVNVSTNYPMINDRSLMHTASFYNGTSFYSFGGVDDMKNVSNLLRIYDFESSKWLVNVTSVKRYGHSLVHNGSDVYLIGGIDENDKVTNDTYRLVKRDNSYDWKLVLFPEPFLTPRAFHRNIITQESDVILYGGKNADGDLLDDIYATHLKKSNLEWFILPKPNGKPWPKGRFGHGQVYSDNRAIFFGGQSVDVWQIVIPEYCNRHSECDSCVVEGCGWCMTNFSTRAGTCYPGSADGPFMKDACLNEVGDNSWMLLGHCVPPPLPQYLIPTLIVTAGLTIIIVIGVAIWTRKMIEEENYITLN